MSSNSPVPSAANRASSVERLSWNLALAFQEVFTAIVRVRFARQAISNAEGFRTQVKQALRTAEEDARRLGFSAEDTRQVIFAVVAFLDESVLSCRRPEFSDWPRLPLQAELFGHQLGGEVFFQELQKVLARPDSPEVADVLEVYILCLLLGFKGRYAAGGAGDLRAVIAAAGEKIRRVRRPLATLSPKAVIPAEPVHIQQSDRWIRPLAITSLGLALVAIAIFAVSKVLLVSGASEIGAIAAQLGR